MVSQSIPMESFYGRCPEDPLQDAEVTPRVQFGHPVTGRKARKLPVAMAVQRERRRMLAAEPNATHIFSLANPRLLSSQLVVLLSQAHCCLSLYQLLLPASHPVPIFAQLRFVSKKKKKGRRVKKGTVGRKKQILREVTLLPVTAAKLSG